MFFEINSEKKIGFKKLFAADLGLSQTSHQTHIGLFDRVLTFLPDSHVEKAAIFIYQNYCDILTCEYGKINRKDGEINAPKIQSGDVNAESVVRMIRKFAKSNSFVDWYLVWFGTDSEELVFWLISSDSKDYTFIRDYFKDNDAYNLGDVKYMPVISYLEKRINDVSSYIQKDLEIVSQVGDVKNRYKRIDVEKAAVRYKEIGVMGEKLVAEYLSKEKVLGNISNFIWENQSRESGKPFDFIVDDSLATQHFIDVKSTCFDFSQDVVFSENEISFVNELINDNYYYAYRVFNLNSENKKLSICNRCIDYLGRINNCIINFHDNLAEEMAYTKNVKIAVKPNVCFKTIQPEIVL